MLSRGVSLGLAGFPAVTLGEARQLSEPVFSSVNWVCCLQEVACRWGRLIFVTRPRVSVGARRGPARLPSC